MMVRIWRWGVRGRDALLKRWWQFRGHLMFSALGVKNGEGVRFYGLPVVSLAPDSSIELGSRVVLCSHPHYTALGVARPVVLRTLAPGAVIRVGSDVGISGGVICAAVSVEIGNQCLFGADVQITDTDFHPLAAKNRRFEKRLEYISNAAVVIEDNVFLGAGVRVLKGVRIGRNTVVGAGSIVVRDLPSDVVAVGVPARIVNNLNSENEAAP